MRFLILAIAVCVSATPLRSQEQSRLGSAQTVISGRVVTVGGDAVPAATARLVATTDSANTDASGRFTIRTSAVGRYRLIVRKLAFIPESLFVVLPLDSTLTIRLRSSPRSLETVRVMAGTYRAGYDRQASLTPVQVVNVPGAGGDIGRAIQSLPGVQNVDEGNGVYVRGGEAGETRVVLNDAVMLIAPRLESPSGTAAPTVNPFLLDGISFSAGSFSVRRGNALSGLIDLRTQGRPTLYQASANVALNVVSTTLAAPLGSTAGGRLTASRSDAALALRLNGSTRRYTNAPKGADMAGSVVWAPRKSGEIKLFAVQQESEFGVEAGDPAILSSSAGVYESDQRNRFGSLSWRDVFGRIAASGSMAISRFTRGERTGIYHSDAALDGTSAFAEIVVQITPDVTGRVGGDAERTTARLDERFAQWLPNGTTTGGVVARARESSIPRRGAFVEGQWQIAAPLRFTAGLRTDDTEGGSRTYDPRLDVALRITPDISATAAWGVYHQSVAPSLALRMEVGGLPPAAQARQQSAGVQWEHGDQLVRAEAYTKTYRQLTGLDLARRAIAGGQGSANGVDMFAKTQLASTLSVRAVYSFVNSHRTDPEAGTLARSPADVTHSLLLVGENAWHQGQWRAGIAYRAATGRPVTPILGGRVTTGGSFDPVYGLPMSERLPSFARVDISLSTVRALTPALQLVVYSSLSNALDRANVFAYRYSSDFTLRTPVRSAFKRSVYLGASMSYTKPRRTEGASRP